MENAVFALFMMGCGHSLDVCRPIDSPVEFYQSEQKCEAGLGHFQRHVDGFPMAVGTCVAVQEAALESDIMFEWFFAANGSLVVEPIYTAAVRTVVADRTDRLGDAQAEYALAQSDG